jgi:serine/threonine-protein kinase HipA
MISERQCFVYITLPGEMSAVTAGRLDLKPNRFGDVVGRFVYGQKYLARPNAVEIDPVELLLANRIYETVQSEGIFSALRDAGPDYWGRRVIDRHVHGNKLSELDYLLHSPEDRAGALSFGLGVMPPAPKRDFNQTLSLAKLQILADALIAGERNAASPELAQVDELILLGTSMGGARPKVVVEDDDGLWLAKFNRLDDSWNFARVEHAMLQLAKNCGVNVAESRVVSVAGRDILLVKRFDREKTEQGYRRARMVSGLTLLKTDDSAQGRRRWSYVYLAEELRRISSTPQKDVHELFRRMCFNSLISNTDDHPRNHAAIAMNKTWNLSPAYDLTPSIPTSMERRDLAMEVGNMGRFASAENLVSQCSRFLLNANQAKDIVSDMEVCVRESWHACAKKAGVSEKDCNRIAPAFVYPGFRDAVPAEE